MSLCRLMQMDFLHGTGRYDTDGAEFYSDRDLAFGIAYAEGWHALGYERDLIGDFNLLEFAAWCREQLQDSERNRAASSEHRSRGTSKRIRR